MELDGLFIDFYGTIATGDRFAVESICAMIIRDYKLSMAPPELAITWGNRFFQAMDFHNHAEFLTLVEIETRTLVETMTALGVAINADPYVARLEEYWKAPPLHQEVHAFLERCPLPLCVVSNADRIDVDAAVSAHALGVAEVITSEDARAYKPDPKIFEDALALTGWRRDRVLHVGDSLHSDVGGALAAGIRSVWINRAHRIHDIGNHTPDHEFDDLLGVLNLLSPAAKT